MRTIMGRHHLGDSIDQYLVFLQRRQNFPLNGREIATAIATVGLGFFERLTDRSSLFAAEGVANDLGHPGEIQRQAKGKNIVIAELVALTKVRCAANHHQAVGDHGKPDGMKKVKRAPPLASNTRIIPTNLFDKPVKIDQIVT